MIRNPYVVSCKLGNTPYLLPFGKGVEEYLPAFQMNEMGSRIWDLLGQESDTDTILSNLAKDFDVPNRDFSLLLEDYHAFLSALRNNHLLFDTPAEFDGYRSIVHGSLRQDPCATGTCSTLSVPEELTTISLKIGPLVMQYSGPFEPIRETCRAFLLPGETHAAPDQVITCRETDPGFECSAPGQTLLQNEDVEIFDTGEHFCLRFKKTRGVSGILLQKDGSLADIYYAPGVAFSMEELFHALRFPFLVLAQQKGLLVLHSASIRYQDKAYLFSGPSGMGKSTHCGLWTAAYGTPILNGDLNLLALREGKPFCYGLPWCGTSNIASPETLPLGGITFLSRSEENRVVPLTEEESILNLVQRTINPTWTETQLLFNISLASSLQKSTSVYRLFCTKNPESARVMKAAIDHSV